MKTNQERFRRRSKRRAAASRDGAIARELVELQKQVAALRSELEDFRNSVAISSQDIVAERQRHRLRRSQPDSAFAMAWQERDTTAEADDFFELGEAVDQRARKWLLTSR